MEYTDEQIQEMLYSAFLDGKISVLRQKREDSEVRK